MKTIRDLASPPLHTAGRIELIVVRGDSRAPARSVEATRALAGIGLADDRLGARGEAELSTRQVTLIQHEHLPVIAQLARVAAVDPLGLRRNLVISGLNLAALKNRRLRVFDEAFSEVSDKVIDPAQPQALLEIVGPCHPCSRMEETIGPGGYLAMRGHGGMTARVLGSGWIRVGARVTVEPG